MVSCAHWPEFFKKYGFKETNEHVRNPFTFGAGQPDTPKWEITAQDPDMLEAFAGLSGGQHGMPLIIGNFDFNWIVEHSSSVNEGSPLVVDVGGGRGQALKQILAEYPSIPASRLVLQDRPEVIEIAKAEVATELRDIKMMSHDFFRPQPVKGKQILSIYFLEANSGQQALWYTIFGENYLLA